MIETASAADAQLSEIRALLNVLITEVRGLRRERQVADPEQIEALLRVIYIFYPDSPFTASWIFEYAADDDPDSSALRKAIMIVLRQKLTINKLSRFLRQSVGAYNNLKLELVDPHSRNGCLFRVTNVSDSVTTDHSS